jgi:hypothetical protein
MDEECDKYDEHAKKYFKTEDEFKLDRLRNYITPILGYFTIKKWLEDETLSEDKKEGLKILLKKAEENCNINLEKIVNVLKKVK